MLRNLGIRWQILSALALPVLVLGLISTQVTYQALLDMREASQSRELAKAAGGFADLVGGLQTERVLSVSTLLGQPGAEQKLKAVRSAVDQGLAQVRTQVYSRSSSDQVKAILARSASGHAELPALRGEIDSGKLAAPEIITRYSQVISGDLAVPFDLASTMRNQDAADNFYQFSELSQAAEALAQEQLVGTSVILSGKVDTAGQRALGADVAAYQQAIITFRRTADPKLLAAFDAALATPAARTQDLATARTAFQAAGTDGPAAVSLTDWTAVTTAQITALRGTLNGVNQEGIDLSTADYNSAKTRLQLTLGGAIGITLLTLLLALALSRRISAPLRRLTLAATQIRDELPKIVETAQHDEDYELDLPVVQIVGRNEVSQLASAFVDVNAVTVAIAREQARLRAAVADMFVNVARRNQVLLSRQLSLIDQLERNEVNPDALEELFRLDHLATRMRRNAESLLVLAGIESGRRLRDPMPLSDVVRTATSEIEHYSRVDLSLAADPPVYAHLALPIAHLLAELLENATNFSDPGSTVVVMATATEQGVRMTVADDGLGIPAEELLEINARIDEPPTADALSSQRLGFFVVGRLAQRLDAKVTLTSGRARGTAVLIDLPGSLFVPGSLDASGYNPGAQPAALAAIPDQGGSATWTPEPVAALTAGATAGSPFVAAFPTAPAAPAQAAAPVANTLPALPTAFNSAAFDAENALEPVWTPQPDLPSDGSTPVVSEPLGGPGLPARRSVPAQAEAPIVPQLLPLPVTAPVAEPVAEAISAPAEANPNWAEADWAVSEWTAPAEEEAVETWAPPVAEGPGPSLFSGFRSRQAPEAAEPAPTAPEQAFEQAPERAPEPTPEPLAEPVAAAEPVLNPTPAEAVPTFLGSAAAVDDWFGAAPIVPAAAEPAVSAGPSPEGEPDRWQAWDEVATDAPATEPTQVAAASAFAEAEGEGEVATAPVPADPTPAAWSGTDEVQPAPIWAPAALAETAAEADQPAAGQLVEPPEVWTPEPAVAVPPASASEPVAPLPVVPPTWTPEPVAAAEPTFAPIPYQAVPEAWTPEVVDVTPEVWTPEGMPTVEAEPVAATWAPAADQPTWPAEAPAWSPETTEAWTEEATESWAPATESWTPAAEAWAPATETATPALEAWAPATEAPATEAWTPATEAWAPETEAAWTPEPEAWTPETPAWTPEAEAPAWAPEGQSEAPGWSPEPEAWSPVPQPEARPTPEPLMQTLTAAIDILPQRTSLRTALRGRSRRKGDPQPSTAKPFTGGFDPIVPAREFALREGFGSPESEPAAQKGESNGSAPAKLVPEPSRPRDSAGSPVERRQHPRNGDEGQGGRSALASEALTELSRLSSYSPTSMPSADKSGLQRRTPAEVPLDDPEPLVDSGSQRGARTAASVRSMLAGFKAGVERGRTSPAANRPAPTLPPPPRSEDQQ
jgi:signal transduction histidine kinase